VSLALQGEVLTPPTHYSCCCMRLAYAARAVATEGRAVSGRHWQPGNRVSIDECPIDSR